MYKIAVLLASLPGWNVTTNWFLKSWIERLLGGNGRFASCWAPTCIPPSSGASHSNPKLGQMKAVVQAHLAHHKEMPISKVAQVLVAACVTNAKEPYTRLGEPLFRKSIIDWRPKAHQLPASYSLGMDQNSLKKACLTIKLPHLGVMKEKGHSKKTRSQVHKKKSSIFL